MKKNLTTENRALKRRVSELEQRLWNAYKVESSVGIFNSSTTEFAKHYIDCANRLGHTVEATLSLDQSRIEYRAVRRVHS